MEKKNITRLREIKGKVNDNSLNYPLSTLKEMIDSTRKSDEKGLIKTYIFTVVTALLVQTVIGYIISKEIDLVFYLTTIVVSGALVSCNMLITKILKGNIVGKNYFKECKPKMLYTMKNDARTTILKLNAMLRSLGYETGFSTKFLSKIIFISPNCFGVPQGVLDLIDRSDYKAFKKDIIKTVDSELVFELYTLENSFRNSMCHIETLEKFTEEEYKLMLS